jgi:hypothetical protein
VHPLEAQQLVVFGAVCTLHIVPCPCCYCSVLSPYLLQPIQVVGEQSKYSFKKGEIVVVVPDNKDLF